MKGFRRMGPLEEKRERVTREGQEAHGTWRKALFPGVLPS